jgi:sterol desaturase/sphingolipid hydroxylase (fatty acid hydroxylase superfamily)
LMGVSPEATLAASLLIDLQSLVSHFNVDLRAGFLNYIFIGTETHRYHHSANVKDAGNYGNTLAIWDQLFGTFLYRPGIAPERLGVANPDEFPESNELARVLALPFGRTPLTNALGERSESRPGIV